MQSTIWVALISYSRHVRMRTSCESESWSSTAYTGARSATRYLELGSVAHGERFWLPKPTEADGEVRKASWQRNRTPGNSAWKNVNQLAYGLDQYARRGRPATGYLWLAPEDGMVGAL